ncbi:B3 domain-containing protein At3g25182-like [Syzygium oleosum]|uniref:B3 domain-containing protein At3g25182-like n=1 Tax=Syzygium oleosum TaxID=219896 RepID=UPI0011D2675B|nr:B3 domain-containing protein At3g25182-like [Syzygium oleosum]
MSSGIGSNTPRSSDDELEEGEIRDTPSPGDDRRVPDEPGKGETAHGDASSPDDREGCSGQVETGGSKPNTMSFDILTIAATASREEARRSQESSAAASSSSENPSALRERVRRSFFPGVATGDMIGGCEMVLLIEKPLDIVDVSPPARRLTLPKAQLLAKFLRKAEKEALKTRDENGAPTEMKVLLLGPSGETCHLGLIRLDLKSKGETVYHLVGQGWVDIVARNGLIKDQVIRLYSCRIASSLCFALVLP